jgi:hypothetical protein
MFAGPKATDANPSDSPSGNVTYTVVSGNTTAITVDALTGDLVVTGAHCPARARSR